MYQAKALGKNRYTQFETEMDQVAQKRMLLETNLRKALERNELSLNYQPKLSLADNQIVGLEALLRWNHPELGAISPAEFIPVAEECGLILPIGRWVLQTACNGMARWRDQGLGDIKVAVNLSVRQTKSDALLPDILASLKTLKLRPDQLSLEITESVLMENIESNISLLDQLRSHGIKLSIDDFGTGYSSLAYLKRLRIDELKIDRAFVRDIPCSGEDEAIVTAIIALAHSLGLSVVAEGVETVEQLAFLRLARCDHMQGYYFSRPMKAHRVAGFLTEESARLVSKTTHLA
jgi:EAL domain-containing protein (putative c-di-GMP-specific phosphodiesterase class I)